MCEIGKLIKFFFCKSIWNVLSNLEMNLSFGRMRLGVMFKKWVRKEFVKFVYIFFGNWKEKLKLINE